MEIPVLQAERREIRGTKAMRRARAEGQIPGVLYGKKQENINLMLEYRAIEDLVDNEDRVVTLELAGQQEHALIRALQRDHLGDNLQHIDFVRVDLEDKVRLRIPLHFVGTPKGANQGGMLEIVRAGVVANLPAKSIPKSIELEVADLGVDDYLRFKDVPLPEGAELLESTEGIVARCIKARRAAAIAAAAAEAVGAGPGAAGQEIPEGESAPSGEGDPKPEGKEGEKAE